MDLPRPIGGERAQAFGRLSAIALGQAGLAAATTFAVQFFIDRLHAFQWSLAEGLALLLLVAAPLGSAGLRRSERVVAETLGQGYAHAVRLALYDRLASLPHREIQSRSRGAHLLRFTGDLKQLSRWVSFGLARLVVAAAVSIVALGALAAINLALAATVFGVLCLGASLSLLAARRMEKATRRAQRCRGRLASDVTERISVMPVVQLFSQVKRERSRLSRRSKRLREAMVGRAKVVGDLRGLVEATSGLCLTAIIVAGAIELQAGRASFGSIVAAMSVLGMLAPALRDFGRIQECWQSYSAGVRRLKSFVGQGHTGVNVNAGAPPLPDGRGRIEFRELKVDGVLDGVSAVAEAGSRVALLGPNGSGKSTLLLIAARMLEPTSGAVLIDGQDIRRCSADSVRSALGLVSPDLPLMRGTILRNVRYRQPNAPVEEIQRVIELCELDELIDSLPHGVNSRVGEAGANLSPGQRQRIAIARALLGRPRVLLFDEADASLDPASLRIVDRILESYPATIIYATHAPDRLRCADIVWTLERGQLTQCDGSLIERPFGSEAERALDLSKAPAPSPEGRALQ